MNISKKLISYILIGFLCVSSCSITYYKSVHAFEWVEVGISTAEALKWLLGALGIVATGSVAVDNFWSGYEEEFYEYASDENISGPDVRAWLEKLAKGTLDKGSEVWSAFLSWASNLVTENSSGSSGSDWSHGNINLSFRQIIENAGFTPTSFGISSSDLDVVRNVCCASYYVDNNGAVFNVFANCSITYWENIEYSENFYAHFTDNGVYYTFRNYGSNRFSSTSNASSFRFYKADQSYQYYLYGFDGSFDLTYRPGVYNYYIQNWDLSGSSSSSGSLQTINDARQEQFDLINRNTGNEVEQEVAIPMPGVSSGDDTISQDSYDAIMDRVEAGEISIDDAISEIQHIMQVLVYDTETDDVIPISPSPDDPNENQKKDDVLKEEKENMGFTLAGLENVFPFCIPWDIYAFLNILDAEPVAPVFNIPFPNVDDPEHPLTTQVDLSSWDDAMAIVRLAQDFLFIIGLAFLTRSLIGAGGGD